MPLLRRRAPGAPLASGFTLIELLAVLAVAAVLLALAAPALQAFVSSRAVASQSADLVSTLRFARGEAMKRTGAVSVCRLDSAASTLCTAQPGGWQYWMVFVERGQHGVFDANSVKLRVENAGAGNVAYTPLPGATYVSFQPTGIALTDGAMPLRWEFDPTFSRQSSAYARAVRYVCLNAQGRAAVVDGTADCSR